MDLGKAFSFVFDDESWLTTILLGGLIILIPLVGQIALIGFMLETAQNVARGNPRPLPTWNNFGDKLTKGFYGFVIQIVYAIPILVLVLLLTCGLAFVGGLSSGRGRSDDAAAGLVASAFFCLMPLIIIIGLVLQPIVLAAMARYVQTGSLSAALRFGEIVSEVRASLSMWIVVWLINILCGFVASLGGIALGIGALFTAVYAQAVFGHYLGQVLSNMSRPQSFVGYAE